LSAVWWGDGVGDCETHLITIRERCIKWKKNARKENLDRSWAYKSCGLRKDEEMIELIEQDKRRVGWFHWAVLFVDIILIVYSQSHDQVAVEVPIVDTAMMQRYQVELDLTRKQRDDYKKQAETAKKMLLASNLKVAQYEQHLKALAESVPPQPVILEAVRKEAATEVGFRKLVARNFGGAIAKRIEVR
jgi:hypothetical protein